MSLLYWIIDLFTDMTAILNSIVPNSYYGMPSKGRGRVGEGRGGGQVHTNLPPENPITLFKTVDIKMAAILVKGLFAYRSLRWC